MVEYEGVLGLFEFVVLFSSFSLRARGGSEINFRTIEFREFLGEWTVGLI